MKTSVALFLFVAIVPPMACNLSCADELSRVNSPDGKFAATIELRGVCGGATVGYYTEVIVRSTSVIRALSFGNTVFLARSQHLVSVKWLSNARLEVSYPGELDITPTNPDGGEGFDWITSKSASAGPIKITFRPVR